MSAKESPTAHFLSPPLGESKYKLLTIQYSIVSMNGTILLLCAGLLAGTIDY